MKKRYGMTLKRELFSQIETVLLHASYDKWSYAIR
jgi:hypothetical protein